MNYRFISNIIGRILLIEAAFMLPAMIIALYCHERASFYAFAVSIAVIIAVGIVLGFVVKPVRGDFYQRDGLVSVGLAWIAVSAFGAIPISRLTNRQYIKFLKPASALRPVKTVSHGNSKL